MRIQINGKTYQAHRLAFLYMTGKFPPDEVDHINHEPSDNRFVNLRQVTRLENLRNQSLSKNNKSGFTGVSWYGRYSKWVAAKHVINITILRYPPFYHGVQPSIVMLHEVYGINRFLSVVNKYTRSENSRNRSMHLNNKSGFSGVCWKKRVSKWLASISINGKRKHLGYLYLFAHTVAQRRVSHVQKEPIVFPGI
jgi:hypothetical protein